MPIQYKTYKSQFSNKDGEPANYALAKCSATLTIDDINEIISDACSVNDSDILAVLEALKMILVRAIGRGSNVQLYDLGVLKPKISVKFDKKGSVVKGSEEIKTIQFIPTAGFLKKVRKNTKFEYKKSEKNNETFEQRSVRFLSNIEEGTYFTRKKYASFIKKDYEVAVNDLKKLLKANIVSVVKMGNGLFYSKN